MKSIFNQQTAAEPAYDHNLAFDLFGEDGKVTIGCFDQDAENCIAIFGDGSWEKVTNTIGVFTVKKDSFKIPYIKETGSSSFTLKLPKFPYGMLLGIAEFFKEVMVNIRDSESMVQIYWDILKSEYFIHVPVQTVSKAHINFERDPVLQSDTTKLLVCDIHSHNSMQSFWSGVDNSDEKGIKLFGVLGELHKEQWTAKWRAGCNGQYINVEMSDFWDLSQTDIINVPKDAHSKISEHVTHVAAHGKHTNSSPGAGVSFSEWQKMGNKRYQRYNDQHQSVFGFDYGGFGAGFNDYDDDVYDVQIIKGKGKSKAPKKKVKQTRMDLILGDIEDHLYDISLSYESKDPFVLMSLLESILSLLIDASSEIDSKHGKSAFLETVLDTLIHEYDDDEIQEAVKVVVSKNNIANAN